MQQNVYSALVKFALSTALLIVGLPFAQALCSPGQATWVLHTCCGGEEMNVPACRGTVGKCDPLVYLKPCGQCYAYWASSDFCGGNLPQRVARVDPTEEFSRDVKPRATAAISCSDAMAFQKWLESKTGSRVGQGGL